MAAFWLPALTLAACPALAPGITSIHGLQTAWPASKESILEQRLRHARRSSDYGLGPRAWSGLDPEIEEAVLVGEDAANASAPFSGLERDASERVRIQIMGLYNSGTNLLAELVERNLPGALVVKSDNRIMHKPEDCKYWKHSSLSVLRDRKENVLQQCGAQKVVGLAMVRNPLSWLESCRDVFYDLYSCQHGDDWLTRSCTWPAWSPSFLGNRRYENVEEIWANWTQDYEDLGSFGFSRSLAVSYEDLVLDTDAVLAKIAAVAGLEAPEEVQQVDQGVAPLDDEPNGRELAIEKILHPTYTSHLTPEGVEQACQRLPRELMYGRSYCGCGCTTTTTTQTAVPMMLPLAQTREAINEER